jgi:hypothetical protein
MCSFDWLVSLPVFEERTFAMQKQYLPLSRQMHDTTKGGRRTFFCKLM